MKEDTIKRLLQESKLNTSEGFTDQTMEEIQRRIQHKIRLQLYWLISAIAFLFCLLVFLLISSNFEINTFGIVISLPKILSMLVISMIGYFSILHIANLLRLGSSRRPGLA